MIQIQFFKEGELIRITDENILYKGEVPIPYFYKCNPYDASQLIRILANKEWGLREDGKITKRGTIDNLVYCVSFIKSWREVYDSLAEKVKETFKLKDGYEFSETYHALNGMPLTEEMFLDEIERLTQSIVEKENKAFENIPIVRKVNTNCVYLNEKDAFKKIIASAFENGEIYQKIAEYLFNNGFHLGHLIIDEIKYFPPEDQ